MDEAEEISEDRPILVDSFLDSAVEVDVDAVPPPPPPEPIKRGRGRPKGSVKQN